MMNKKIQIICGKMKVEYIIQIICGKMKKILKEEKLEEKDIEIKREKGQGQEKEKEKEKEPALLKNKIYLLLL